VCVGVVDVFVMKNFTCQIYETCKVKQKSLTIIMPIDFYVPSLGNVTSGIFFVRVLYTCMLHVFVAEIHINSYV
jgi:hypothetical protein